MGVAGSILLILGLYLMTMGVRTLRLTLGVVGFLTFGALTWIGLANSSPSGGYSNDPITMITVPAGLGILGAVCYIILERVTVYLIGALGGLALALYICSWREDHVITQDVARACFLAVLPIFMTAITFMAKHYMLLFSTAFAGSYIFIVGIDLLAHTGYLTGIKGILDRTHQTPYDISTHVYAMLAMTIVLCLISLGCQYFFNKGKNRSRGGHVDDDNNDNGAEEEVLPAAMTAGAVGGFSSRSSYAGGSGSGHHTNTSKKSNSNGHGLDNGNNNRNGGDGSHGFENSSGPGNGNHGNGSINAMHNLPRHSYPSSRPF
ncbi:hypothetical protein INT45_009581 [Circinella minor]|uniref:Transmembrane protein 198 n=1 Tax=Circinella minor TaxID=1195481 RepID=A0A8H7S8D3_9FUNG|nr:hypothetical protein INT45_009581 [Circinella minor]